MKDVHPKVYIVIPVFNRWQYTRNCLTSLLKQTYHNFDIVVVDHGSTDGTRDLVKIHFPEVILVEGDSTMWWTAATNFGIKHAFSISNSDLDFILTLNNDLEVESDYIFQLLQSFEFHKPCLVGSLSVDISNSEKITFLGGTWNKFTAKYKVHSPINLPYSNVKSSYDFLPADLLPGRGVLIPKSAFHEVGFYDEINFPHYTADDDFSLRCKKNGYKLIVSIKAVVKSHINDSSECDLKPLPLYKYFYNAFTSIKSPNRCLTRLKWARKHTPFPYFYFSLDMIRVSLSIIKKKYFSSFYS